MPPDTVDGLLALCKLLPLLDFIIAVIGLLDMTYNVQWSLSTIVCENLYLSNLLS